MNNQQTPGPFVAKGDTIYGHGDLRIATVYGTSYEDASDRADVIADILNAHFLAQKDAR